MAISEYMLVILVYSCMVGIHYVLIKMSIGELQVIHLLILLYFMTAILKVWFTLLKSDIFENNGKSLKYHTIITCGQKTLTQWLATIIGLTRIFN